MLRFSIQFLWRNWRSGEIKILALSLTLAIAVVTAIAVFADRMDQSLVRQSNSYLAADRVIEGRLTIPQFWRQQPENFGLQQADTAEFSSMVFSGGEEGAERDMQLASVKAVSEAYPLRGHLEVSTMPFALGDDITLTQTVPQPGQVWVDSRLLPLMDLALGDQLTIGNSQFTISRVVIREPDSTTGFAVLGPRVMMNLLDLPATGVIQPGSRVTYRWLLAGEENDLKRFENWLQPELGNHHRLIRLQDAQQNIGSALDRGARFLMLAGVIGVLLAGVAISVAAQQFAHRHIDQVALMKSLGISANQVRWIYCWQMLLLGGIAALGGTFLGEVIQQFITASIASLFNIQLLTASPAIYSVGLLTGLLCLLCFVLPPLWYLPTVSPLKVIRRELTVSRLSAWLKGLFGAAAVVILIWVYSGDSRLTLAVAAGLVIILLACLLIAMVLLLIGKQLGTRAGSIWRLAIANLLRYQGQTITQMLVFACALMLLMVLFSVRTSLIDEWRLQLPENAPNHFVLNIAPYERAEIETLFSINHLTSSPMYPMVLGRLLAKNEYTYQDSDRDLSNVLRRELNLSWAEELAPDNKILEGQWWETWQSQHANIGVSVEQDTAAELGIKLGDTLSYSLGGLNLQAEVASIRSVDWNAMTPNFYFLFSPGALDNYSPNYLTSLFIPAEHKQLINQLLRNYPTIVVLEVDRIIERIRTIVSQVSRGIELVLWLVLVGGIMVLVAAVNASMANRMQEAGLLRALGSGRRLILGSLWTEFSLLGLLSGILAVIGAEALLLSLQGLVFNQPLKPHFNLWLSGPLLGAMLIGLLGLLSCRKVITVPPGVVLREIEA